MMRTVSSEALSAEGLNVDSHPVTGLHICDVSTDFFHYTHHFMADCDTKHGAWYAAVLDMQVTGADAAESHPDQRILRSLKGGLRLVNQFEAVMLYVCVCFHLITDFLLMPR